MHCLGDPEPSVVRSARTFRLEDLAELGNDLGKTVELNGRCAF